MGTNEVGTNEAGTNEAGTNEAGANEVGANEVGTHQSEETLILNFGSECLTWGRNVGTVNTQRS